jgi:hypothetical protein
VDIILATVFNIFPLASCIIDYLHKKAIKDSINVFNEIQKSTQKATHIGDELQFEEINFNQIVGLEDKKEEQIIEIVSLNTKLKWLFLYFGWIAVLLLFMMLQVPDLSSIAK